MRRVIAGSPRGLRKVPALALALGLVSPWLMAADPDWVVSVDVPSTLGGADRGPNEFLETDGSAYALLSALPAGTEIGALDLRADGTWLFSPNAPTQLGGATYEPRDVVSWDGSTYGLALDGDAAGVPAGAGIDAVSERPGGDLALSFDVPTTIATTTYGRADVVLHDPGAGFSLLFDASAAGVPPYADLVGVGFDREDDLVLSFDVPVDLGGTTYLNGQLVAWDGATFRLYAADPGWPRSAIVRGIDFFPPAGAVPDGDAVPGTELRVARLETGEIRLSWGDSCLASDTDFAVYEGGLAAGPGSHVPVTCSTGGLLTATFNPDPGDTYYLVAARNVWREGSHGLTSGYTERPRGASPCLLQLLTASCPERPARSPTRRDPASPRAGRPPRRSRGRSRANGGPG